MNWLRIRAGQSLMWDAFPMSRRFHLANRSFRSSVRTISDEKRSFGEVETQIERRGERSKDAPEKAIDPHPSLELLSSAIRMGNAPIENERFLSFTSTHFSPFASMHSSPFSGKRFFSSSSSRPPAPPSSEDADEVARQERLAALRGKRGRNSGRGSFSEMDSSESSAFSHDSATSQRSGASGERSARRRSAHVTLFGLRIPLPRIFPPPIPSAQSWSYGEFARDRREMEKNVLEQFASNAERDGFMVWEVILFFHRD
jgi:hypothetical protein